jgi:hypothetical protein
MAVPGDADERERLRRELEEALNSGKGSKIARAALTAVGGAIPFAGGIFSAAAGTWSEKEQERFNKLFAEWMKLEEARLREIAITMMEILSRVNLDDETVRQRVESPEYQALLRKAFRDWAATESEEKRKLVRNLLCNAAESRIAPDDIIKLFIDWIRDYSELHFRVIRELHKEPGTRAEVWQAIHAEDVREDSMEADLFKLLISDLTLGYVIRLERRTNAAGQFLREPSRRRPASSVLKSAFEGDKPYELTALGRQFVHYTMNEIVPKLTGNPSDGLHH